MSLSVPSSTDLWQLTYGSMQGGADVYMWLAFAYSSDAYITAYINPLAGCAAAEGE